MILFMSYILRKMTSSKQKFNVIQDYQKRALESIPSDHPHKEEIKKLLVDQINDDLSTHANSISTK